MSDKIPYMTKKRLASGRVAYYFNLPKHRRPAGWKSSTPLGDDYLDAVKKAVHLNKQLKTERDDKKEFTIRNSLKDVYQKYTAKENRFYSELGDRTRKGYSQSMNVLSDLKNENGETFDNINLDGMKFIHAEKIYMNLVEKHGYWVARSSIMFLKMIYGWAVKYEYYAGPNPFKGIKVITPRPKKKIIEKSELITLLRVAKQMAKNEKNEIYSKIRLAIHVNYWICQRPSDVVRLHKNEFFLDESFGFFHIVQGKTKAEVSPAIPPFIARQIDKLNGYIFGYNDGKNHYSGDYFSRFFMKVKQKAGLDHVNFKDLRHTGATAYKNAGVSSSLIISITGHTTETILNSTYAKNTPTQSKKAAKQRMGHSDSKM